MRSHAYIKVRATSEPEGIIDEYQADLNPGSQPADGITEKYALVIGITEYDDGNDLLYADDDAYAWANYLEDHGYYVILLTGRVTSSDIEYAIYELLTMEDGDDYVAFIYSGHGYHYVLIPYLVEYSMIVASDLIGITERYLYSAFTYADSSHIFFFFDACQIGGMATLVSSGRYVAMASDKTSLSYEYSGYGHGVFTYYFLIKGILDIGYVYMEDAFDYAYSKSLDWGMNPTEADGNPSSYFALYPLGGGGGGGGGPIYYEIA